MMIRAGYNNEYHDTYLQSIVCSVTISSNQQAMNEASDSCGVQKEIRRKVYQKTARSCT